MNLLERVRYIGARLLSWKVEPIDEAINRSEVEYETAGQALRTANSRVSNYFIDNEGAFSEDLPEPLEEERDFAEERFEHLRRLKIRAQIPRKVEVVV